MGAARAAPTDYSVGAADGRPQKHLHMTPQMCPKTDQRTVNQTPPWAVTWSPSPLGVRCGDSGGVPRVVPESVPQGVRPPKKEEMGRREKTA